MNTLPVHPNPATASAADIKLFAVSHALELGYRPETLAYERSCQISLGIFVEFLCRERDELRTAKAESDERREMAEERRYALIR